MKEAAYSAPKLKAEINENQLKHLKRVQGESYFGPQIFLLIFPDRDRKETEMTQPYRKTC